MFAPFELDGWLYLEPFLPLFPHSQSRNPWTVPMWLITPGASTSNSHNTGKPRDTQLHTLDPWRKHLYHHHHHHQYPMDHADVADHAGSIDQPFSHIFWTLPRFTESNPSRTLIREEYNVYGWHLGERAGKPNLGWLKNMFHSVI